MYAPIRSLVALTATGVLGLSLAGCTGGSDPKPSTSSASSSASASSSGVSADALAKEVLAQGTSVAAPAQTVDVPDLDGQAITIGIESLTATSDQTVLTLVARSVKGTVPGFFTAEDSASWRDLHPLSIEDPVGKTRYYPYRYKELPTGVRRGSTSPQEPGLKPGVWQQWGAIILPPLPATVTSVTVNIPRGLSDSAGLASKPIGTMKNVPVTRS